MKLIIRGGNTIRYIQHEVQRPSLINIVSFIVIVTIIIAAVLQWLLLIIFLLGIFIIIGIVRIVISKLRESNRM